MTKNTLIIIPARLASRRLNRKMLADINGEPLILKTYRSAVAAGAADVIVACDGEEIASIIRAAGGTAIITDPDLPSGTDRICAAYEEYCKSHEECDSIVNLQGDLPFIGVEFIEAVIDGLYSCNYDIHTLATPITDNSYTENHVVKPVIAFSSTHSGRAIYFSRSVVPIGGPYYHHVGIYSSKPNALRKLVSLAPSSLELSEKLEQLRALENGMTIGITVVHQAKPISVDVQEDLLRARRY
ncbi:MAG: 3-deoxy-manno-octulosonate cytidylyltransferase [Holosporaceae bacterium]|jgi:3-deoxy-manno-octulosonate cytidylyltransferase (CMP-KDO synthetase)|nr:3-deoxy-manno-octulosonate cytidylyltransferase [Holosporaceae bacterium]